MRNHSRTHTTAQVASLGAGNHSLGDNLYARNIGCSRTWAFRWTRAGKTHWLTLGRQADWSYSEARQKARECHRRLFAGEDLAADIRVNRAVPNAATEPAPPPPPARTFGDSVEAYIDAFSAGWGDKQAPRWRSGFKKHAATLLPLPVSHVDLAAVLACIEPIWRTKNETAGKLRGRIAAVLDYSKVQGWRTGDNPAEWRGHLEFILPNQTDVAPVQHRPSLPYQELPATLAKLKGVHGAGAACAIWLALTGVRSSEARNARWSQIDESTATWVVPPEQMKGKKKDKREHRVPLSPAAVAVLESMRPLRRDDGLVFPGGVDGRPLTDVAPNVALKEAAGRRDITIHGLRATFQSWADEVARVPREISDSALAHVVKDKTARAYQRSDLLERRRELMNAWAEYCFPTAQVTNEAAPLDAAEH